MAFAFRFAPPRGGPLIWLGLLATLLLLLGHAAAYAFLTDDAFISFRYARNLADGHGLVFNPAFERVEGYTNFLWVAILAGFSALGVAPESAANPLSIAATVLVWALLAGYALGDPPRKRPWLVLAPLLLLACTRSVAVWATSGLETRLFEVLVFGAALRLITEIRSVDQSDVRLFPLAALLFALAALTRPDANLMYAFALGSAAIALDWRRRPVVRALLPGALLYAGVVGSHLAFRRLYYGDWLPNTYYAKVGGRVWWDMGWAHHASFGLEYAIYLWIPLLVAGVLYHRRRGTAYVPALFASIVVPHAIYVASIGGDHFEYRPQDLYFPFAFVLIYDGLKSTPPGRLGSAGVVVALAVVLIGLVTLPAQTRLQFPAHNIGGFPGAIGGPQARAFLAPERDPIYRLPGLQSVAEAHRRLLWKTTEAFVGIRQEEHDQFLESVRPEGEQLRALVARGLIPADAHIAIDSVGALAYLSDLRILDRLGLNDASVARSGRREPERLLGHDQRATLEYARSQGVDFWALDRVHSIFPLDAARMSELIREVVGRRIPAYVADVGDGFYLLGILPQGSAAAERRFPKLRFRSLLEPETLRALEQRGLGLAPSQ